MNFSDSKSAFLLSLNSDQHQFKDTLSFIDRWYNVTNTSFNNGSIHNDASENQGSAKVLALAIELDLSIQQVLACFGEHYRDVLATPNTQNHFNLRRLIKEGLVDISFESFPLKRK